MLLGASTTTCLRNPKNCKPATKILQFSNNCSLLVLFPLTNFASVMKKIAAILLLIFALVQAGPAITTLFSDATIVFIVDEEKGGEKIEQPTGDNRLRARPQHVARAPAPVVAPGGDARRARSVDSVHGVNQMKR